MRWKLDMAACNGAGCPKRENCRRFQGHEQVSQGPRDWYRDHRQVYMLPPDDPENCAEFWPEVAGG